LVDWETVNSIGLLLSRWLRNVWNAHHASGIHTNCIVEQQ